MRRHEGERKTFKRHIFGMVEICAAVSLAGMICCCEAAARTNRMYCEGRETYRQVQRAAGMEMEPVPPYHKQPEHAGRPAADITGENLPQIPEQYLRRQNSAYTFWLYIPGTSINYPVVWHEDNRYYLDHKFDGEAGACGCLFADCRMEPITGPVTIVYGHNMRDGSMFAGLKNYTDEAYLEQHRTIYLFHGGTWTACTVKSCQIADETETAWPGDKAGGENGADGENGVGGRNAGGVHTGNGAKGEHAAPQRRLILYTCHGSKRRLAVQAVIEGGG